MKSIFKCFGCVLFLGFIVLGCSQFADEKRHYSSSVLDYLFPDEKQPSVEETPKTIDVPFNLGIAFVPDSGLAVLDEKLMNDLMVIFSDEFVKHDFVSSVELIPSKNLKPKGGFANLDQIKSLYSLDVIVLIGYDQVQHTAEGVSTYLYWTWVGSYTVKGEKNDTNTLLDATILDIENRKKLLHLTGTSHIKGSSTLVNLNEQLRNDSVNGFMQAGENLLSKLKLQLPTFLENLDQ
jgi:rhombotail lipoprotein